MKKRNEEVPDNLGGLGEVLSADVLKKLSELLDLLHLTDHPNQGSNNTFIYVARGAQYVKNLYQQIPQPDPPQRKTSDAAGKSTDPPFDVDTPLSALFRENHQDELRKVIDSWRPYLVGDEPSIDALAITRFEFDFRKILAKAIYIDLGRLLCQHPLEDDNIHTLANDLFHHSNLSNSQPTIYAQLRKYKKR